MKALTFSDVLIVPQYSEILSRKDIDISSSLGQYSIELPIISANMKSVTGPAMAIEMCKNGGRGALHRFNTIERAVEDYKEVRRSDCNCIVSIGVQEEDKERFEKLYEAGALYFIIDIAHGHALSMKNMVNWIRDKFGIFPYIIGGNVATGNAAYDLADWGCNAVKVGIGGGSACMTRKNTGVGVPQLYAIHDVHEEFKMQGVKNVSIISDGGITSPGDVAKAFKYSDFVMVGGYISGTTECPGSVFKNRKGELYKVYAGSASGETKVANGKTADFVEGIAMEIPFRGHVKYMLKEIKEGVQSAFSYVGASNMKEFKEKCEFIEISDGGRMESKL